MTYKVFAWGFLSAAVLVGALESAHAADLPSTKSDQPAVAPDASVPPGYLFNFRPYGAPLGDLLANDGIYITGRTINEGFTGVSGGVKQDPLYEGFTSIGLDFDTHKILGLPKGGGIHLSISGLQGQPYWNDSGSAFAFNRVWTYNDAVRFNALSYEQKLFNDKLDVVVGRFPIGLDFDAADIYCRFVTGLCSFPPGLTYGKGNPAYLTASYAALARLTLPHHFYFNIATYADQPNLSTVGHYDWPGRDWDFDNLKGVTIPMQLGYATDFTNDPLPRSYSIGGSFDTEDYTNPYYNTVGQLLVPNGGTAAIAHGKSDVWLQAQQMVWRPDMDSDRGLTLFGGANFRTGGVWAVDNDYFLGGELKGMIPGRPQDTIGLMGEVITENAAFTSTIINKLREEGYTQYSFSGTQPFLEINYGLAIAPGVTLRPFFQYIWNPDQDLTTPARPNLTHAAFFGAAFTAYWADTFGLPKMQLSGM